MKEEDENSKFFHAIANGHKNRNFILMISHEGRSVKNGKEIGQIFSEVFQAQIGSTRNSRFCINWMNLFSNKFIMDLIALEDLSLLRNQR